ncbi:MAG: hypothetical protein ABSD96_09810 [Candidatus Korobacteraceae bacterium]
MRRVLVCCLVLAVSLPLLALKIRNFEQLAIEQRRVVSAYCRLDFQGARLSPEGWDHMRNLTIFRENPDFVSFFVVLRYQLIETHVPTAQLSVAYTVIGRYEDGAGYTPMPPVVRNVAFELHDQNGELRISGIDPDTPFVSRNATIDWLKAKLVTQNDMRHRVPIEAAIKALEAQTPGAPASK